jgi:hypothetical protein
MNKNILPVLMLTFISFVSEGQKKPDIRLNIQALLQRQKMESNIVVQHVRILQ